MEQIAPRQYTNEDEKWTLVPALSKMSNSSVYPRQCFPSPTYPSPTVTNSLKCIMMYRATTSDSSVLFISASAFHSSVEAYSC